MNPYVLLGSGIGTSEATSLSARLAAWHDAMVAHERRLRTGRTSDTCDDECPHVEARTLWAEALATFGARAGELTFLRSRAMGEPRSGLRPVFLKLVIRVPMKGAHLALVALAEPDDEAPCYEIHGLGSNENRITNHRRMNQKQ